MFLYSKKRNGNTDALAATTAPKRQWEFMLPSFPSMGVESFPCFDAEGNAYFGSHDCCFYSVNTEGKINWSYSFKRKVYSSPLLHDGRLYFVGGDGYLHCLTTQGQRLWSFNLDNEKGPGVVDRAIKIGVSALRLDELKFYKVKGWASPNITSDGQIIVTGLGDKIFSIDAITGKQRWAYKTGRYGYNLSGAAIDSSDSIYIPACDGNIYCFDRQGKVQWKVKTGTGLFWGNVSLDEQEQALYVPVFVKKDKTIVYKIDKAGKVLWKAAIPAGTKGSVATGRQGDLYAAGTNGVLVKFSAKDGAVQQTRKIGAGSSGFWTTPVIDGRGNVMIGCKQAKEQGAMHYLDTELKEIWKLADDRIGKIFSPPHISVAGVICFGTWNGNFLCYK